MKTQRLMTTILSGIALMVLTHCKSEEGFYTNVLRSDVYTQLYAVHDYDFLWVFDNSGSMASRRAYVRDNMQNFINILNGRKAVNFQMAVTDTDFFTHAGNLVAGTGGITVVKSATSSNPVLEMAGIINNVTDSMTSFWEQGLESAYQAVAVHKSEFSRPGVPLVVIILSDENDFSCKDNCFGVEPENNPNWVPWDVSRYIDYFKNVKASENSHAEIFPIVGMGSGSCTVASYGARYEQVMNGVGGYGISGSICASELPAAYANIAKVLADRGIRFPLSSAASGSGITVFVNSIVVPYSADNGWIYEAETNSIVFTGNAVPTNGATIEVTYNQATN